MSWLLKSPDQADVSVYTDASTSIGLGGYETFGRAYQIKLSDTNWARAKAARPELGAPGREIAILELLSALIAADLWASFWSHMSVSFYNDNPAAAGAIRTKRASLGLFDMNYLIRTFATIAWTHEFMFWGIKVDGSENTTADQLSRFTPLSRTDLILEPKERVRQIANKWIYALSRLPHNIARP